MIPSSRTVCGIQGVNKHLLAARSTIRHVAIHYFQGAYLIRNERKANRAKKTKARENMAEGTNIIG
jgi:hypothetical protein